MKMRDQEYLQINMRMTTPDSALLLEKTKSLQGISIDLHKGGGHYSPYDGNLMTIGYYKLFPVTIRVRHDRDQSILISKIKTVLEADILSNHTALAIRNKNERYIVIQGPMQDSTKRNIFDCIFDNDM